MPRIPEQYLDKLRVVGLHVSHPIGAFNSGVYVCKPAGIPGNSITDYSGEYGTIGDEAECPQTDAPMLRFYIRKHWGWVIDGQDCNKDLGYGDFVNVWGHPENAVDDILDFFLGAPDRMNKKADRKSKRKQAQSPLSPGKEDIDSDLPVRIPIPEPIQNRLRSYGLYLSDPIGAFNGGFYVCKPTSMKGNCIPGYTGGFITISEEADYSGPLTKTDVPQCPDIDAPMLRFYIHNGSWIVDGCDCAGGMGPADFLSEYGELEDAIQDIQDFFFGNPTRMNRKKDFHENPTANRVRLPE